MVRLKGGYRVFEGRQADLWIAGQTRYICKERGGQAGLGPKSLRC